MTQYINRQIIFYKKNNRHLLFVWYLRVPSCIAAILYCYPYKRSKRGGQQGNRNTTRTRKMKFNPTHTQKNTNHS